MDQIGLVGKNRLNQSTERSKFESTEGADISQQAG